MNPNLYPKIRQESIFEKIISHIKDQLNCGNLNAGDQLPTERDLSEMMGVNRHSVREAFRVLEFLGVIERKVGVGTVVKNVGQDLLAERLKHAPDFSPDSFLCELLELRMVLEPAMASLAAKRATEAEIEEMAHAIRELKAKVDHVGEAASADIRLHMVIAKATHNITFSRLFEPVLSMLSHIRERMKKVRSRRQSIITEHEDIFNAIESRDSKKAEEAMRYHLTQLRKSIME